MLKADVVVYNEGTEGEKYADMSCVDTSVHLEIGCIKVVFVNKFVNALLVSWIYVCLFLPLLPFVICHVKYFNYAIENFG